jgi:hypothetical protein
MLRSIIVVTVLTCALTAQAAPTQWAAGSGGNDHWYEVVLVAGGTTWGEAKTAAENAGG